MPALPRPRPLSKQDLDRPLNFWEEGPLRKILEMEFDLILEEELARRGVSASAGVCNVLHDAVVPEAFLFLTKNVQWTPSEELRLALSLMHQKAVHREILGRISVQIDRLETSLGRAKSLVHDEDTPGLPVFLHLCPQED